MRPRRPNNNGNLTALEMLHRLSIGPEDCLCHVQRGPRMSVKGRYFWHCQGQQAVGLVAD